MLLESVGSSLLECPEIMTRNPLLSLHDPGNGRSYPDRLLPLLNRVAWLMDRAFRVPGTNARFGLDGLLGLLPLGGDVATGLVQAGLVLIALRHYRVPPSVAARMVANVLIDVGIGAIPVLGDLFDFAFKANTRNLALLEPFLAEGRRDVPTATSAAVPMLVPVPPAFSWGCLLAVAVPLLGALLLVLIGFVAVIRWLLHN